MEVQGRREEGRGEGKFVFNTFFNFKPVEGS